MDDAAFDGLLAALARIDAGHLVTMARVQVANLTQAAADSGAACKTDAIHELIDRFFDEHVRPVAPKADPDRPFFSAEAYRRIGALPPALEVPDPRLAAADRVPEHSDRINPES